MLENVDNFYMVPSEEFQINKYSLGTWTFDIFNDADYLEEAFQKWMDRYIRFAKYVKEEAERCGYYVIVTDGAKTIEQIANEVRIRFNL